MEGKSEKFKGYIEGIELLDLIQLANISKTSFVIEVENFKGEKAKIYMKNGSIIHVEAKNYMGKEALYYIFFWKNGKFKTLKFVEPSQITVNEDTTFLLLELARLKDEFSRDEKLFKLEKVKPEKPKEKLNYSKNHLNREDNDYFKKILALISSKIPGTVISYIVNLKNRKAYFLVNKNHRNKIKYFLRHIKLTMDISKILEEKVIHIPLIDTKNYILSAKRNHYLLLNISSDSENLDKKSKLMKEILKSIV